MNLLYRGVKWLSTDSAVWEVRPCFVANDSTEVYVQQKTWRSFWSYGKVDKSVINRRSVTEEVREQEVYGNISPEEITSQHLPWDLNARSILQHCMLTASILAIETVKYIYIYERHGLSAVLPPKLLLLCRILATTLISCTIRELWLCVIFPHVKFITSPYQKHLPLS